jgi:hypothetical protein
MSGMSSVASTCLAPTPLHSYFDPEPVDDEVAMGGALGPSHLLLLERPHVEGSLEVGGLKPGVWPCPPTSRFATGDSPASSTSAPVIPIVAGGLSSSHGLAAASTSSGASVESNDSSSPACSAALPGPLNGSQAVAGASVTESDSPSLAPIGHAPTPPRVFFGPDPVDSGVASGDELGPSNLPMMLERYNVEDELAVGGSEPGVWPCLPASFFAPRTYLAPPSSASAVQDVAGGLGPAHGSAARPTSLSLARPAKGEGLPGATGTSPHPPQPPQPSDLEMSGPGPPLPTYSPALADWRTALRLDRASLASLAALGSTPPTADIKLKAGSQIFVMGNTSVPEFGTCDPVLPVEPPVPPWTWVIGAASAPRTTRPRARHATASSALGVNRVLRRSPHVHLVMARLTTPHTHRTHAVARV